MVVRLTKILMSVVLATFAGVVIFVNLTDYGSNYLFVQHVLNMDTTFPHNMLLYRATTNPTNWKACYGLVIAGEGLTFILLALGSIVLWRARRESGADFDYAKRLLVTGHAAGFVVWFFAFTVVEGEWFAMWQSKMWNGQEAAFRFYMAIPGVLIFLNQRDADLR
jgi:predicted small integral membrane protein